MRGFQTNTLIFIIILLAPAFLAGQDAIFSQLHRDDIYMNPANSFISINNEERAKIDLQFRDQWSSAGTGDTYTTVKFQGEYNLVTTNYDSWNIGALLFSDRSNQGDLTQTSVRLLMAYSRKLSGGGFGNNNTHFVSFGSSLGFAQTSLDFGNFWFGRQYNTELLSRDLGQSHGETFNIDAVNYLDINLGVRWLYIMTDKNQFGASFGIDHINKPLVSNNSSSSLHSRLSLQMFSDIKMDRSLTQTIKLSLVQQHKFFQINPGYQLSVGLDNLEDNFAVSLGLSPRLVNSINGFAMDAMIFDIGLSSRSWRINFSFDLTTSEFKNFDDSNGAIEMTLGYRILKN